MNFDEFFRRYNEWAEDVQFQARASAITMEKLIDLWEHLKVMGAAAQDLRAAYDKLVHKFRGQDRWIWEQKR